MAVTTNGTAHWGVSGGVTGVTGIVTSLGEAKEPIMAPEYNEIGQVVKQTKYDELTTLTATVEVAQGTALPDANNQITINGKKGYVKRAELVEDNQAYRKISITVELYKNCDKITTVN